MPYTFLYSYITFVLEMPVCLGHLKGKLMVSERETVHLKGFHAAASNVITASKHASCSRLHFLLTIEFGNLFLPLLMSPLSLCRLVLSCLCYLLLLRGSNGVSVCLMGFGAILTALLFFSAHSVACLQYTGHVTQCFTMPKN